jgi:hypothetical protein
MLVVLIALGLSINTAYSIDPANLVGAWLFEGEADEIVDASGNGHNGEIAQGAPKRVKGKFGGAMEFGGADMITVPDDNALDLANFTISAWIKVDGQSGQWQIIASKENRGPTGRNYGIFCNINTGVVHYSFTANAAWQSFDAATVVTDGNWHHVAATYEKPDFKMYLDGAVDAQVTPGTDPDQNDSPLYIGGCDIGDYWMTGIIDEIVLFNVPLSEAEIGELMEGLDSTLAVQPATKLPVTWGNIKSK